MNENFYFRQLLAGRDFAVGDAVALSMRNFTYALGDRGSGQAVLVDPAYRPGELLEIINGDDMTLVGAIATHYHPDHIGGTLIGDQHLAGILELVALVDVPVHVQADEVSWVLERTGVDPGALEAHQDRDVIEVGEVAITLLHTPGHTPGSQCLLVEDRLLSGDTLFLDGCGRTDFPGGSPTEMYRSLSERLAAVSGNTLLYPGHLYSREPFLSLGEVRARNQVFAATSLERWLTMFGA